MDAAAIAALVDAALADKQGARAISIADAIDQWVRQHEPALAAERDAALAALKRYTDFRAKVKDEAMRVRELVREGAEIIKLP